MKKEWTFQEANAIFHLPFPEIMYNAQTTHRANFSATTMQTCTLINLKVGSCPENCSYCAQSAHYKTNIEKKPFNEEELVEIIEAAKKAKEAGSTRICLSAAWRGPRDQDLDLVCKMIKEVKKLGVEACVTLGLLKEHQAQKLKDAGLDFYNHNIDTSEEFYSNIITTRTFQDRLDTLENVRKSGIKTCSGGIFGMGETNDDRIRMLLTLANLDTPPESVPINKLIPIPGTPLENQPEADKFDFVRAIALARIMMPKSWIRLTAGRENMSDELQSLCFLAGANSIFYGEKLLTANNPIPERDNLLLKRLGFEKLPLEALHG
jgi:biotin synthase